jgi:hypothetical protein
MLSLQNNFHGSEENFWEFVFIDVEEAGELPGF